MVGGNEDAVQLLMKIVVMSRFSVALCCLALLFTNAALALDKERLWLPVKYQSLYLSLVKAAETAETLDRCAAVVEGTLDIDQSTPDHPIYRILCRQDNGLTYNEMVDGLTFTTLTTPGANQGNRWLEYVWKVCRNQLMERTSLMTELTWITDLRSPPQPDFWEGNKVQFVANFDARGVRGERLQYAAECTVSGGTAEVSIRKR
ncbi:hypothetical protein DWB84_09505 [Saccharophagus sp. K07]|jgi:hypothetical protein|nr:hypothetical protein [Saccharophagus sp. K07]